VQFGVAPRLLVEVCRSESPPEQELSEYFRVVVGSVAWKTVHMWDTLHKCRVEITTHNERLVWRDVVKEVI
jgi:hypothetical protein